MGRPTYVPIADSLLAIDDFGRATNVFQALRDNIAGARVQLVPMDITEKSTSSSSYVTLWNFPVHIPSAVAEPKNTAEITAWLEAKVSANNGDFRLKDSASGNVGSAVNVTATSYADIEPTLTIQNAWRGTTRTIIVQTRQNTAGTAFGKAENSIASRFDY